MNVEQDIKNSRSHEMKLYREAMSSLYESAVRENQAIYDLAYRATDGFRQIDSASILADSRIIKILRYAVVPSVSQMKLGQFVGLSSVGDLEAERQKPGSQAWTRLESVADSIAAFASTHIDSSRFAWLENDLFDSSQSQFFARAWTCSLVAEQNAQTAYRSWRRQRQESAITEQLRSLGYRQVETRVGTIESVGDLESGTYVPETRVRGRTVQKADVAFRSSSSGRLVLIEAKAVGVLLDATKRVKECSDKASDWRSNKRLAGPQVVAVIGGFFSPQNISNLMSADVAIVWEHRLSDLGVYT